MRDAVLDAGRQGTPVLERNLYWLQTVAQGAPLLGLLGTVFGMIKMFAATSLAGLGDPRTLSQGISEAMFATAEGLCIGIPALFAYNYLAARSERHILEIESYASRLVARLRPDNTERAK
jgi:biopolymer transport protein ExbB